MSDLIGQLHPAIVHLPIGILLVGLLLIWLSKYPKYNISQQVIKLVMLAGTVCALFSAITGYILSNSNTYKKPLIEYHMWSGILLTLVAMLLYMKIARKQHDLIYKCLVVALFLLILITGYLGGSITHGDDMSIFKTV